MKGSVVDVRGNIFQYIFVCVTLIGVKSKYGSCSGSCTGLININNIYKKGSRDTELMPSLIEISYRRLGLPIPSSPPLGSTRVRSWRVSDPASKLVRVFLSPTRDMEPQGSLAGNGHWVP